MRRNARRSTLRYAPAAGPSPAPADGFAWDAAPGGPLSPDAPGPTRPDVSPADDLDDDMADLADDMADLRDLPDLLRDSDNLPDLPDAPAFRAAALEFCLAAVRVFPARDFFRICLLPNELALPVAASRRMIRKTECTDAEYTHVRMIVNGENSQMRIIFKIILK